MVDKCVFTSNISVTQFVEAMNLQSIGYFYITFYSAYSKN